MRDNVVFIWDYRGRCPSGWEVWPNGGCVQPPIPTQTDLIEPKKAIRRFADILSDTQNERPCNPSKISVQKSGAK